MQLARTPTNGERNTRFKGRQRKPALVLAQFSISRLIRHNRQTAGSRRPPVVSNTSMGTLRSLRKFLLTLILCLGVLSLLAVLASQVEQYLFRRRAELLLSQIQSLELRKTSWQNAQTQLQQWDAIRKVSEQCDSHKCSFKIALNEFVAGYITQRNLFIKLDDYFRWRLKLSYGVGPFERMQYSLLHAYVRMGGHPARIIANIGMRDGVVWSKEFYLGIETYGHPIGWSGTWSSEFTLAASVYTVSRFDRLRVGLIDSQLMLHPYYAIGKPGGCSICVAGWAIFTPYAAPEDVRRLMQMDLSCLTRWGHCLTQTDIMPATWAQYLAEHSLRDGTTGDLACSPWFLEVLGRDSANIALVEILRYHDTVDSEGYHSGVARTRLLRRLKGVADWEVDGTREVPIWGGNFRESLHLLPGTQLVLFRDRDDSSERWIGSLSPCPIVQPNEINLSLIRRGIDQDYSATDKAK